jgi:hypothetical protein
MRSCKPRFRKNYRRKRQHRTGRKLFELRRRLLAFEILEDRAMLSVAQDLVNQLTPYQSSLSAALDAATSLPLVDTQLAALQEFDSIFANSLSAIDAQTQGISTNGHYQRSIALGALSKTFTFDLGLDEFLQVSASGGVSAAINPTLHVGFNYQNGTATLVAGETSLDLGFNLSLPNFQATASFNSLLFTKAIDAGTTFQGNLGFDFNVGGGLTPQFTGLADVNLDLSLSFVDPALNASFNPTFVTRLNLDWGFGTDNQLTLPSIQLANFGLDASSFLDGFLGDIVETAQKFTKPIQPFIDVFQTPVPIISSFGSDETIGTLMLKGAGASEIQQQTFSLMVDIIGAINSIDLSNGAENAVIPFGTITLTGDARQDGFGFNTSQLGGAIDDIFGNEALQGVEDALDGLGNYAAGSSSSGFAFPLLEHPETVIGSILTGTPEAMFSFSTGRQHFELAPSLGFGIPGIFGIFLEAGIFFDANLTMGYDTAGLIELAQTGDPASLLHGFYFDNSIDTSIETPPGGFEIRKTGLYLKGAMQVVADVAIVHVSGGLYADIKVELENNSPSDHLALDDIGGKVFDFGGRIYASADLEVSLELPIGPNITFYEMNLAEIELLNFDPPPPPAGVPTTVIDVVDQHTLLLDVNKMSAGNRVVKVQPFHDLTVTLPGGGTAEADGIRVDYPGEVYLFVERKDDVTTNYYNLIGLNGPTPDRVSINMTDPFRVFVDEGAANPYPAQTKPGVLMAGGKDVLYKYNEFPDGTQPIVLMVGGFGSNTLSGGTMMFGNFIPAGRIAQAKGHFADVTGYDGAGQAYINSVIDAAIAPADPTGIISATMTASRGGLMFGGPGNNSFFAAGPGAYEMIGGNWINTFNISPSFGGQPATYQIDGGGGDSRLVVRVPAGELADFENGTVPDNYDPAYKALDIYSNAGKFATAHGITKVTAVSVPGATVVLGDTSELNIEFDLRGSGMVKFGGSPAPDSFDVSMEYSIGDPQIYHYITKYHRHVRLFVPAILDDNRANDFDGGYYAGNLSGPGYIEGPFYTITLTFGTNGRTQTMVMNIESVDATSISLDGRGASDAYHVAIGSGGFLDITIDDTDETTQNELLVDTRVVGFYYDRAILTDSSLQLEFYSPILYVGLGVFGYLYYSSISFLPTIYFDANTNITHGSYIPFRNTIINRPNAPQSATILIDGQFTDNITYFPGTGYIYDPDRPNDGLRQFDSSHTFDVQVNAGSLTFNSIQQFPEAATLNIHSNTGTISVHEEQVWWNTTRTVNIYDNEGIVNLDYFISDSSHPSKIIILGASHVVNVLGNSGTINVNDVVNLALINQAINTQVKVGNNGSLANVDGTINLSNLYGRYGLKIDNHLSSSSSLIWLIDSGVTTIGDLTITYPFVNLSGPFFDSFSKFELFTGASDSVTLNEPPFFIRELNGASLITWQVDVPSFVVNQGGDFVNLQAEVTGDPGGPVTYSASNLPAGLSINPTTGLISGTIPPQTWLNNPSLVATVTASQGQSHRQRTINWFINSGIEIFADFQSPTPTLEGTPVSVEITTTNRFNRPVTLSVNGLPPGLSFNPATNMVSGTVAVGAAQNGPYYVTVNATDGFETAVLDYTWSVIGIDVQPVDFLINRVGDTVNFQIPATSVSGGALHFEAAENALPTGLTLNPNTGVISGVISNDALSKFVIIRITQGNDVNFAQFQWTVLQPNEVVLPNPNGDGTFLTIQSTVGTTLEASISPDAGVALPVGWAFPFDFLTFTVSGLTPGATADVTLFGLDSSLITDYYKYGATPANPTDHWYKFLFNQQTDADNATGTGMEIVFGQIVLHLIDGGRGDDDLAANGVIQDIGGAAIASPDILFGDYNLDNVVDGADYVVWRYLRGSFVGPFTAADGDGDAYVDQGDYNVWRANFGNTLPGGSGAAGLMSMSDGAALASRNTTSAPPVSSPVTSDEFHIQENTLSTAAQTPRTVLADSHVLQSPAVRTKTVPTQLRPPSQAESSNLTHALLASLNRQAPVDFDRLDFDFASSGDSYDDNQRSWYDALDVAFRHLGRQNGWLSNELLIDLK